ncbi:hypothetical protein CISG_02422 [Coccidioides immitis RMSCC 3703]|uniref:Uncharacterized protein n=1 Tax=Coccidioides immitis RMSCC 3703 TaxID=454286 RepID=A0A0J8U300_COCIT|nr:hypothetical protein CISG_02422 [Coccidioides immitis RMSCC 3703]
MSLVTRTRVKGAKKCSSLDEPIRNLSFTGHLKDDIELHRKRSLNSRGAKNVGERRGVGVGTLGARVGTCETAKQGSYWPPRARVGGDRPGILHGAERAAERISVGGSRVI